MATRCRCSLASRKADVACRSGHSVAAREILHKEGFTTHLTQVICVAVADEPGGLARVLDTLAEQKISVDYLYSISFNNICFAVHDVDRAVELLSGKVTLLSDEQVKSL